MSKKNYAHGFTTACTFTGLYEAAKRASASGNEREASRLREMARLVRRGVIVPRVVIAFDKTAKPPEPLTGRYRKNHDRAC